ncbi:hypothetical protein PaecuDRAFT_4760 [Paenibacillus curdlanolyticus YK9]|uniref:Uncharacterized protein n=1 Tax=Paenibacillus curdlanolyticus YK9 TaxID=717606 RepID=E0IGG7_9BACL|nr:hypothetical protein [Paenibacillus curdlanolyticus]EFM08467.1 hypothetical protein PaecuDRAFT_4760 [Paenibacillus curdlanolyticus YK9]
MKTQYIVAGVILVALLLSYFLRRAEPSHEQEPIKIDKTARSKSPVNATPDYPVPFGYKCQWLAIKTTDTQAVIEAMQLQELELANWSTGIDAAHEGCYFVSPPVHGWTLVVNALMPDLSGVEMPSPLTVIDKLSSQFGEAYYFGTHRVVDYHAWAKSMNGKVVRANAYLGEAIIDQGEISQEERYLHMIFTGLDVEEPHLPSEEDVLLIAKEWTVDPQMEEGEYEAGTGFVGRLK